MWVPSELLVHASEFQYTFAYRKPQFTNKEKEQK